MCQLFVVRCQWFYRFLGLLFALATDDGQRTTDIKRFALLGLQFHKSITRYYYGKKLPGYVCGCRSR